MKRAFVTTCDLLSVPPQIYYINQERYSSVIGAIMTILVAIAFIIVATYFFVIYSQGYA